MLNNTVLERREYVLIVNVAALYSMFLMTIFFIDTVPTGP